MTVLRSEIGKVLDELISDEGGMKFQDLAVILVKQKYPEFIACERKKDLGLDARAPAQLSADRIGKGLASSITASLKKIFSDAEKIKEHFDDVTVLIFATPKKVSNQTAEKWVEKVLEKFGFQLIIMSRQEIITSLMLSSNAQLCRSFGIPAPVELEAADLIEKVRDAASKLAADRLAQPPLLGKPLLSLRATRLDDEGKETGEVLQHIDFKMMLTRSRRIVLEAPAGRGKTTTLIQLANQYSQNGDIAFLIELPAWLISGQEILDYISQLPHFRSFGIDSGGLAKAYDVEHIVFLLNGWNEISDSYSEQALIALQQLERTFPAAGIIVATRTHHLIPPLPGAVRTKLLPLNRAQRAEYLKSTLGSQGDEIRSKLDNNPVLDELTRTPLILSKVVDIFAAELPIPTTKVGVLNAVMGLFERSLEHQNQLQAVPLMGHARTYLSALATQMLMRAEVMISEQEARPIVRSVSVTLRDAGQISAMPEPQTILNTLCTHHILERIIYPSDTFRFQHQQFQEFFAALLLKRELWALMSSSDKAGIREFTKKYVNEPTWTEPLQMLAEEIGIHGTEAAECTDSIKAGKLLVEMALGVDPIFAAELARLCGSSVWKEVRPALTDRLGSLYQAGDPNYRHCALAAMLASGSVDFIDIILPLLTSEEQQVRLKAYRSWDEFHLSTLGPNWQNLVGGWKEEARIDFVRELTIQRWIPEIVESLVLKDPSLAVRVAGIESLSWIGSQEEVGRVMEMMDQEAFEKAIQRMYPETIPKLVRPRALTAYEKIYSESPDALKRLRALANAVKLGEKEISDQLKTELDGFDRSRIRDAEEFIIKPLLRIITKTDPQWVNNWIATRISDGSLLHEHWNGLITKVPEGLRDQLFWSLAGEDFKYQHIAGIISVLATGADPVFAETVFSKLCEVRRIIATASEERHEHEWAIARQLEELFRALPPNVSVAGLSNCFEHKFDGLEFIIVLDLFSRVARPDFDIRGELADEFRQKLRAYLKSGLSFALSVDDFPGELKAKLASSLAQIGEPEDIEVLRQLIQADIERVRRGRAAHACGDRTPLGQGGMNTCARRHVESLEQLDHTGVEGILLELLQEPEYEFESASALVRLASRQRSDTSFWQRKNYQEVWKARDEKEPRGFEEARRKQYATAIQKRIFHLLEEYRTSDNKNHYNFRLKRLAEVQAVLDSKGSAELVIEVMSLPGEWDGWTRVKALESLLFGGAKLPTKETLCLFDMTLELIEVHRYQRDQEISLIRKFLCLLSFVDDPSEGLKKVQEVISKFKLSVYEIRDVVVAIGYSRCNEAVPLLRDLSGPNGEHLKDFDDSWIDAVATLDSPEARRLLLSVIDPEINGFPSDPDVGREDILTSRIAELGRGNSEIEQRLLQLCDIPLTPRKRMLLSEVIAQLNTPDSILAGLNLIRDDANPPIPYGIERRIETAFVEQRPYGRSKTSFTLAPRSSNIIRKKLFEMVTHDESRKRTAFALLGKIEVWRLEYGRPTGEPRHPSFDSGEQRPPHKKMKY